MNKVKSPKFGVSGLGSERVLGPLSARQRAISITQMLLCPVCLCLGGCVCVFVDYR